MSNNVNIKDVGFVGTYIRDFDFEHVAGIPEVVAVAWVKALCPKVNMGLGTLAENLTVGDKEETHSTNATGNGWLNKLFIIVGMEHGKWIALYNHDGRFGLKIECIKESRDE